MLFKISTEKLDRNIAENNLTFVKTHISDMENTAKQRGGKPSAEKWTRTFIPCMIIALGGLAIIYILVIKHPSHIPGWVEDRASDICSHKHRTGSCMAHNHCCDGEYLIGNNICPSTGFCCLGTIRDCEDKSKNKSDFWSFPSLTQISSKIIYRNVSEPIVELAIVSSLSALEQTEYFNEISSKIEADMSSATGHKWFCVIGNKDSFDLNLNQFSAFIFVTINELEIVLFKMAQNIQPSAQPIDYSSYELNDHNIDMENDMKLNEHEYGLDTRPTIEILRNEMNENLKEFAIQTIDYVLNSCINSYSCVTLKLIQALNQQFGGKGNEWQCIITSNTVVYQLVADIQHLRGFLLDFIYNNKHRILIYKTEVNGKTSEMDVIKSGRKALAFNKTTILENNLFIKANNSILTEPLIIEAIRRAVMTNDKFQTICENLTSMSNKYSKSWSCFAGPHHSFGYYMSKDTTKPYLIIKLNQLVVILFQKTCNQRYKI